MLQEKLQQLLAGAAEFEAWFGSFYRNILRLLMTHPGQVFSSAQIYEQVWNDPAYGSENTVAVHIRHLREKIEINPADPRYLKVVWGLGYKIDKGGL